MLSAANVMLNKSKERMLLTQKRVSCEQNKKQLFAISCLKYTRITERTSNKYTIQILNNLHSESSEICHNVQITQSSAQLKAGKRQPAVESVCHSRNRLFPTVHAAPGGAEAVQGNLAHHTPGAGPAQPARAARMGASRLPGESQPGRRGGHQDAAAERQTQPNGAAD